MSKIKKITEEQKNLVLKDLKEKQKEINYETKDLAIEYIVYKFSKEKYFIPKYQRNFIWNNKGRSAFIESVLLGLPIPFMFFSDCENGKYEIIDGAQRVQTLNAFTNNDFSLSDLEKLKTLEGFKFEDLPEAQQEKFKSKTMRVIVLGEDTPSEIRMDLFLRINTYGVKANPSEVRRGAYDSKLTKFIEECCQNDLFKKLAPISEKYEKRYERFELTLRFFAYLNSYENFKQSVAPFLDDYLDANKDTFDRDKFINDFEQMLCFVEKTFPFGFAKTINAKSTPRVRFEALAVGSALALRENPNFKVEDINWINSQKFDELTKSDSSNSQGKLKKRIEYVKNKLLGIE